MKIIDLSVTIQDKKTGAPSGPPNSGASIDYGDGHYGEISVKSHCDMFGVKKEDMLDGDAYAIETVEISTHGGTHMDAPYHYHATMNHALVEGGEPAWTIDQVPLEWCMGRGVVVDARDKPTGYQLTSTDFIEYFSDIGYTLQHGDCVLLQTCAAEKWGTAEYWLSGCGVGREGTLWLIDHGVRCVGTDAWSWDIPLTYQKKAIQEGKMDPKLAWEGHKAGREKAYVQVEKLCNLNELPRFGFKFIALPIKIERASAGWVRAIALIE